MSSHRERTDALLIDALSLNASHLLRYLERRVGADDAPDALGEVMVAAWRRCDDLPADGQGARMWLFGIARNVVLNVQRGKRRRLGLADRLRQQRPADPVHHGGADEGLEVRDAIARLDPDLAELVRTVHWDGFTLAEAAQILGIPASTARSRYGRARTELRAVLLPAAPPTDRSGVGAATRR
ncbi:RNA polymerase sigma factor [Cellulomonas sp. P22]|uniref:RNA polymerase sigma factor n=1 Tax=Cellulomonas sp. P22 TaxID=3373189 RepID=UPI0037AF4454